MAPAFRQSLLVHRQRELYLHDGELSHPLGLVGEAVGQEPLGVLTAHEQLDDVAERVAFEERGADAVEEHPGE